MNELYEKLMAIGEPYAAGLFEAPEKSIFYRYCAAAARWYRNAEPMPYLSGQLLYPCGNIDEPIGKKYAVRPHYCKTWEIDFPMLSEKCRKAGFEDAEQAVSDFWEKSHYLTWIHGAPNYERVCREGLDAYRDRIAAGLAAHPEKSDFYAGLLLLVDAMRFYAERCLTYLRSAGAPQELIHALSRVPFRPAESYYEGLVCWNVIFYFDFCDNLGCFDQGLAWLYRGEDLTDIIGQLFDNLDKMERWSCGLGPIYNDITRQALRAGIHRRRPMLALRVTPDMPRDLWELASEGLREGGINPSFYNDKAIHDMLHEKFPRIPEADLVRFCTGGCTETNLAGISRSGGTDGDVNLARAFSEYIHENLAVKETFADFFEGMCRAGELATEKHLDWVEDVYRYHAQYVPLPMRTLLFDDCIDKGLDYNAGGCRYSWTMNSDSGLINVIDSLAAVKKLYYEEKRYTAEEFLRLLDEEDPTFFAALKACPCFGIDDEETDRMGAEFTRRVYMVYRDKKPKLEFLDGFMLTEHQFSRYEWCGACVGPTPDGRHRGQPTCDSIAALRGKAIDGPTAMLRSAARLPQHLAEGISVLNLTLAKKVVENPAVLQSLITGYFAMGGVQIQVTVTSVEALQDAMIHPEAHGDLLVRVGGYSEYFKNLTPGLRQAVLERNIHEAAN